MQCISCHKELSQNSKFCNYCGAKQEQTCPSCGATLTADSLFCNLCGTKLGAKAPEAPKQAEFIPIVEDLEFTPIANEFEFTPITLEDEFEFTPIIDEDDTDVNNFGDFCELQREHYAYSRVGHDWTERIGYYNKKIYSIKENTVYVTHENGMEDFHFSTENVTQANKLLVNTRGIFVFNSYIFAKKGVIAHYSLDGTLLNTLPLKGELVNRAYAYGDFIWMLQKEEDTYATTLLSYDFSSMTHITYSMPWKKGVYIDTVYGTREKAILHIRFEGKETNDEGWYLFDLIANTITCLSDSELLPEWVVSAPKRYETTDEKLPYRRGTKQDIRFFDLKENLMWVVCEYQGKEYLSACSIAPPQDAIHEFDKVWYVDKFTYPHYFDGKVMYHAPHYAKFGSIAQDGSYTELKEPASGHGRCDHFLVLGDYVYIDMDAQYKIFQHPNNPKHIGKGQMMPTLPSMQ